MGIGTMGTDLQSVPIIYTSAALAEIGIGLCDTASAVI